MLDAARHGLPTPAHFARWHLAWRLRVPRGPKRWVVRIARAMQAEMTVTIGPAEPVAQAYPPDRTATSRRIARAEIVLAEIVQAGIVRPRTVWAEMAQAGTVWSPVLAKYHQLNRPSCLPKTRPSNSVSIY